MRLTDIFDFTPNLNEIFDSRAENISWEKKGTTLTGDFEVSNEAYRIKIKSNLQLIKATINRYILLISHSQK